MKTCFRKIWAANLLKLFEHPERFVAWLEQFEVSLFLAEVYLAVQYQLLLCFTTDVKKLRTQLNDQAAATVSSSFQQFSLLRQALF